MSRAGPDANRVASSFALCPGRHFLIRFCQKKSADKAALKTSTRHQILLDLGFLEFHVLAGHGVIFLHRKLFRFRTGVLFGHIEVTCICGGLQLNLNHVAFGHNRLRNSNLMGIDPMVSRKSRTNARLILFVVSKAVHLESPLQTDGGSLDPRQQPER
jgi:hypothetical protein